LVVSETIDTAADTACAKKKRNFYTYSNLRPLTVGASKSKPIQRVGGPSGGDTVKRCDNPVDDVLDQFAEQVPDSRYCSGNRHWGSPL
jgi:hypothetical protein